MTNTFEVARFKQLSSQESPELRNMVSTEPTTTADLSNVLAAVDRKITEEVHFPPPDLYPAQAK